jgi:hypothetical protein
MRGNAQQRLYEQSHAEASEELKAMLAAAPPGAYEAWEAQRIAAENAEHARIAEPIITEHRAKDAEERAASPKDPADAPQLVVDGIKVALLFKSTLPTGNYPVLIYRCGDDLTCAYQSKSEGLWRLAVNRERAHDFILDKGHNYTTTTQIHMDLQPFFSTQLSALPEVSWKEFPYLCEVQFGTDYYNKLIAAIGYESPPTTFDKWGTPDLRISPNPIREFKHPVFDPLNVACNENCFVKTFDN